MTDVEVSIQGVPATAVPPTEPCHACGAPLVHEDLTPAAAHLLGMDAEDVPPVLRDLLQQPLEQHIRETPAGTVTELLRTHDAERCDRVRRRDPEPVDWDGTDDGGDEEEATAV